MTTYEVLLDGRTVRICRLWADVIDAARASGWMASAVQSKVNPDGTSESLYIDPHMIAQDYRERGE